MSKKRQQGPHGTPDFIDILSPQDRKLYEELHKNVGSTDFRYNRYYRISTFNDTLKYIREYCEHDEKDQWKRYLVCGICQFENCIALNIKQLRLLISKCKSTINGALNQMGYQIIQIKGHEESILLKKIPFLADNYSELKHWSIRKNDSLPFIEDENKNDCEKNKKEIANADEIVEQEIKDLDEKINDESNDSEFSFFKSFQYESNSDFDFMDSDVFFLTTNSQFNINMVDIENAISNSKCKRKNIVKKIIYNYKNTIKKLIYLIIFNMKYIAKLKFKR